MRILAKLAVLVVLSSAAAAFASPAAVVRVSGPMRVESVHTVHDRTPHVHDRGPVVRR